MTDELQQDAGEEGPAHGPDLTSDTSDVDIPLEERVPQVEPAPSQSAEEASSIGEDPEEDVSEAETEKETTEVARTEEAEDSESPSEDEGAPTTEGAPSSEKDEAPTQEPEVSAEEPEALTEEEEGASAEEAATEPSDEVLPETVVSKALPEVPWWPFLLLLAAWVGVVGMAFFTLSYDPAAAPIVQQEGYAYIILAGLVLAILGPLLSLLVWFVLWHSASKDEREGLLTVSLVRGAAVTFFGVVAWWGTIVILDALRLGLIG